MNTYATCPANPFRMRTYPPAADKSRGMNTYKKVGEGVPAYCYVATVESSIGSSGMAISRVRPVVRKRSGTWSRSTRPHPRRLNVEDLRTKAGFDSAGGRVIMP